MKMRGENAREGKGRGNVTMTINIISMYLKFNSKSSVL